MNNYLLKNAVWIFFLAVAVLSIQQQTAAQNREVNIRVTGTVQNDPVPSGENVIYNFVVSNIGPTTATEVILVQNLPSLGMLKAAVPSIGYCHGGDGRPFNSISLSDESSSDIRSLYCVLGDLPPNNSASISVSVKTPVFGNGVDSKSVSMTLWADVSANEKDLDPADDHVALKFDLLPSRNRVPIVQIVDPVPDSIFTTSSAHPLNIQVKINASDPDGSITKVQVYDGIYLGDATASTNGTYTFNFTTTETRRYILRAIAIDDGGRESFSSPVEILINSPHTISITKPSQSLIAPGSGLEIETESIVNGNKIQKVEIVDRGISLGEMQLAGVSGNIHKHRLKLPNIDRGYHTLTAYLTDVTGAASVSPTIFFKVTNRPTVAITSPSPNSEFASNKSVYITVQAADSDGRIQELEFLANDRIIGNITGGNGITTFRWISPDDGVYVLTVRATDDTDEKVVSKPITIRVGPTNRTDITQ